MEGVEVTQLPSWHTRVTEHLRVATHVMKPHHVRTRSTRVLHVDRYLIVTSHAHRRCFDVLGRRPSTTSSSRRPAAIALRARCRDRFSSDVPQPKSTCATARGEQLEQQNR